MERRTMYSNNQNRIETGVEQELDLWDALLHADGVRFCWNPGEDLTEAMSTVDDDPEAKISYPWNPMALEAEHFLTNLEQPSIFDGLETSEITGRANTFFNQLDHLWSAASVQASLMQRFAARVPQNLLTAIANRAQALVSESLSFTDQLVQCVQASLPNLAEEDLSVLARQLAPARGAESTLASVRPLQWDGLSDIEQAKLSLAIAHQALAELKAGEKS